MKNGEIAEQGSHEDLIKKKVCISTRFKSTNPFVFELKGGHYAGMVMFDVKRAAEKGNRKKSEVGKTNSKFRLIFSSNRNKQHEP